MGNVTQGFLRSFINDYLLIPATSYGGTCSTPPINIPPSKQLLNFQNNPTITLLNNFLTGSLAGSDHSYSLFNAVIGDVFQSTYFFPYDSSSATQPLGINDLSFSFKGQQILNLNLSISDIHLGGVGTFKELNLLQPINNFTFDNHIFMTGPIQFSVDIRYTVQDLFPNVVHDELHLEVSFSNLTLAAEVYLELAIPEFFVTSLSSLSNISTIVCVLKSIKALSISNVNLDFTDLVFSVNCIEYNCTSPLFQSLTTFPFTSPPFSSLTNLLSNAPGILFFIDSLLQNPSFQDFTKKLAAAIQNSNNQNGACSVSVDLSSLVKIFNASPPSGFSISIILALAIAGISGGLILLLPLAVPIHFRLKRKLIEAHLKDANDQPGATPQSVARFMAKSERESLSMASHPAIPLLFKIAVPVIAVVNITFLFMSFLYFLALDVNASLALFGNQSVLISLLPLTIGNLIDVFWNAGIWWLALGLVIVSGLWPILKNIFILFIFYAPKWSLHPEQRIDFLAVLDLLGRVSFLEAFIVVVLAGALRFEIFLNQVPALQGIPIPTNFLILNVSITLDGGLVILCVAAMATLTLNFFMVYYAHLVDWSNQRLYKQIDGEEDYVLSKESEITVRTCDYVFSTKSEHAPHHDRFSNRARLLIPITLIFCIVFVFIGQVTPFYTIHYGGLIGIVLGVFIQGGQDRVYSLMNLGIQVQNLSDGLPLTNFKLLFFQVLWYIAIIIAPLLQLALHLFLFFGKPLKLSHAKMVLLCARSFGYWASIDVFVVTTIVLVFIIPGGLR